jgi:hypothetical protein
VIGNDRLCFDERVKDDENELIEEMLATPIAAKFIPAEYGLTA